MRAPTAGHSAISVEALWMWFKASPTPVPIITDYYLDDPSTQVLLGGGTLDTHPNPGFRVTGAHGLDGGWGIEAIGFYVPSRSTSSGVASSGKDGSTDLMLPFFDVTIGTENITEISYSPEYAGNAQQTLSNDLWGVELNATRTLAPQGPWRVDLVGGLRYLQLTENYTITTSSPYIPPEPADIWNTTDRFDTHNRFWGLQIGARAAYDSGNWIGSGMVKVALGSMQQKVSIDGGLVTNDYTNYGATQTFPGGYFALPTNIGDYSRNVFAVVPEVALSIGYRLTPAATIYVGYAFLYASDVARPGEQINRNINPTQTVSYGNDPPVNPAGPAQPTFSFSTTDFWAQSLTIGLAYRF
ncbi:MAG: BBP7 family outer membrane beta-barrel protein [Burkholderiales bacterium]|nr:BBP7 family outer membrane beta-barrel protein [Burkholderiales bacterium]